MFLKLKVIGHNGLVPVETLEFRVDQLGGVIGRLPDCNFVLPDPEKFVSRKHGVFKFENGDFFFTDTSAAGTYLSNRDLLLHNETVTLRDGDQLKIGNYELLAQIISEGKEFEVDYPVEAELWPTSEHQQESPLFPESPLSGVFLDPFDSGERAEGKVQSFIGQPDAAPEHASFVPPEPAPDIPNFNIEDLLKDIETPAAIPKVTQEDWQFPDDFFGAIPDESAKPPIEQPQVRIPTPGGTAPPRQASTAKLNRTEPPSAPPAITPVQEPLATDVSAIAKTATSNSDLFRQFLEGAGLSDLPIPKEEQLPALMKTLGILFHDLVDGMILALRARAEIRREFRVTMTTMRAVDNNPLKSMPSPEDAIKIMLSTSDPGFLGPVEAVREGFRDLMNHQMATTAGVQASLAEQMKRFDPKQFEKLYEEGIVFQKKAKCWDAYSKAYPDLVTEALENIFGDEFREVYEQQLRNLRSTPGQGS